MSMHNDTPDQHVAERVKFKSDGITVAQRLKILNWKILPIVMKTNHIPQINKLLKLASK